MTISPSFSDQSMPSIEARLTALEAAVVTDPQKVRRTFVRLEGVITEDRTVISQAELDSIEADPRFDVFIINITIV